MRRLLLVVVCILLSVSSISASSADTAATTFPDKLVGLAESILKKLTWERDGMSLAVYPAASYSAQQGFAFGVMPMMQFRSPRTAEPTTITPCVLVSTKKMFEAQCEADVYLHQGVSILSKCEFYYLPDKYYGIGNADKDSALADYDVYRYSARANVAKRLGESGFKVGVTVYLSYLKFKNVDTESFIADEISYASKWSNALGATVAYDNRDDVVFPRRGWYVEAESLAFGRYVGGRHNFGYFSFDARRYLPVGKEAVFAMQLYWAVAGDKASFYNLPSCGGTRLGRAIPHSLKYIDHNAWLAQGEMRMPLFWRLGCTAFVAAGNVSKNPRTDFFDNTHLMAGGGLRFKVFPSQGLNLRLDAGVSSRGDHAIYFNIREAF